MGVKMMSVGKLGKAVFCFCLSLIMASACWNRQAKAAPASSSKPSIVKVENGKLIVQRRLPDGNLESPKPYLIKGTTWQPATRATSYFTGGLQAMKQWMRDEFVGHYQEDLALMKGMNVNTVRVYIDFGVDPAVIKKILDECYRNEIMVIMTVAAAKEDLESTGRFDIYSDFGAADNHYVPSGWMGDRETLSFNDKAGQPFSGTTCIKIIFNAFFGNKWAGIFWQSPENNWGDLPGIDLRGYNKLVFMAKSDTEGQVLDKVQFGGISNKNGQDTAKVEVRNIVLHKNWQQYSIDLSQYDLSNIRGGFCVVFNNYYGGRQTLYLDDIHLTGTPQKPRYQTIVELYKDHPAILMWSLGNEWNLSFNLYYGYTSVTEAAQVTQQAALRIKQIDSKHPVSSCLGDRFDDPVPANTISSILAQCPEIDIWGLNIYRGISFGDLFSRWKNIAGAKPFYFSEFGTDSFRTIGFTAANNGLPASGGFQAAKVTGSPDQAMQRDFDMRLWEEIKNHLAPLYANELCNGGLVHEWSDAIWKVGNYNVNLGGLIDYLTDNYSYHEYNPEGFVLAGHPDGVANEEYFGVVDRDRKPKLAYYELRDIYAKLKISQPPIARIKVVRRIRNAPAVVSFRGDGSSDSDGKVISYYWDFGDRSFDRISRLRNPTHRFFDLSRSRFHNGYTVTLTVTDNDGLTSTASVVIPVTNSAR